MNILVTGAGLIGCNGAKRLLAKGHRVVLYDVLPDSEYIQAIVGKEKGLAVETADLRDLPALFAVMRKYNIDTVVHTAGLIGKKVAEHPYTGFTVNVQGSVHVAEAVRIKESLLGTNEYVYAKDVAQAIEKACIVTSVKSRAFNVGTGVLHSAQEVVRKVCEQIPGARVELAPPEPGDRIKHRQQPLDISRARSELGYQPEYSMETALADYIKSWDFIPTATSS